MLGFVLSSFVLIIQFILLSLVISSVVAKLFSGTKNVFVVVVVVVVVVLAAASFFHNRQKNDQTTDNQQSTPFLIVYSYTATQQ
jgi:chromate transport protein ChrA